MAQSCPAAAGLSALPAPQLRRSPRLLRLLLFAFAVVTNARGASALREAPDTNVLGKLQEDLAQLQRAIPVLQPPLNLTKLEPGFPERICIARTWTDEQKSFCCYDPLFQDLQIVLQGDYWHLFPGSCDEAVFVGPAEAMWRATKSVLGGVLAPVGMSTDGAWQVAVADLTGGDRALRRYLEQRQEFIEQALKSLNLLELIEERSRVANLNVLGGVTDEENANLLLRHFRWVSGITLALMLISLFFLVTARRHRFLRRVQIMDPDADRRLMPHSMRATLYVLLKFIWSRCLCGLPVQVYRMCFFCCCRKEHAKGEDARRKRREMTARTGEQGHWRINWYCFVSPDMITARVRWPFVAALYMALQLMKMHNGYRVMRDFVEDRSAEKDTSDFGPLRWLPDFFIDFIRSSGLASYSSLTSYLVFVFLAHILSFYNYWVLLGNSSLQSASWLLLSILLVTVEAALALSGLFPVLHGVAGSNSVWTFDKFYMETAWAGVVVFAFFLLYMEQRTGVSAHLQEVRGAAWSYVGKRLRKEEVFAVCKICLDKFPVDEMQGHLEYAHGLQHGAAAVQCLHALEVDTEQEAVNDRFASRADVWLRNFMSDAWLGIRFRMIRWRRKPRQQANGLKKLVLQAKSFAQRSTSDIEEEEDPGHMKAPIFLSSLLLLSLLTPLLWVIPTVTSRVLSCRQRVHSADLFFTFHSQEFEDCEVWLRTGRERNAAQRELLRNSCIALVCSAHHAEGCPASSPGAALPPAYCATLAGFRPSSVTKTSSNVTNTSSNASIANIMRNYLLEVWPDAEDGRLVQNMARAVHLCGDDPRLGHPCAEAFAGLLGDLARSDAIAAQEAQWVLDGHWESAKMPPETWRLHAIAKAYYGRGASWLPVGRMMAELVGVTAYPGAGTISERACEVARVLEQQLEDQPMALGFWTQFDAVELAEITRQLGLTTSFTQHYVPAVLGLFVPSETGELNKYVVGFMTDLLFDAGVPDRERREVEFIQKEVMPNVFWSVVVANLVAFAAVVWPLLKIHESYRQRLREVIKGGQLDPGNTQHRKDDKSLFQATSFPGFVFSTCWLAFHIVYYLAITPPLLVFIWRSPTFYPATKEFFSGKTGELAVMFLMKRLFLRLILFDRCMMDSSGDVRSLVVFGVYFPVLIFLNFIVAQYQGIIRAFMCSIYVGTSILRVDMPAMNALRVFGIGPLKLRDAAYNSFLDVVTLAAAEYNPAKRAAVSCIVGDSAYAAWYVSEQQNRTFVTKQVTGDTMAVAGTGGTTMMGTTMMGSPPSTASMQTMSGASMQTMGRTMRPLVTGVHRSRPTKISRARIRWHLAVTLIRNPALTLQRGWRLEQDREKVEATAGVESGEADHDTQRPASGRRNSPYNRRNSPQPHARRSDAGFSSHNPDVNFSFMERTSSRHHWDVVRRRLEAGALQR